MKQKFTGLLVLLGAVLAAFTSSWVFAPLLVIILGGFCLGASIVFYTAVYSGTVWGIRIKPGKIAKYVILGSMVGLVFGGYAIITTVIAIASSLAAFEFIWILIYPVALVVSLAVGPFVAKIVAEKYIILSSDNALCLGEIDLFKEIDANIGEATNFVVGFEGVALFSKTNYCYAIYRYEDYKLGELTDVSEVALVGTYFVQKYHNDFTFKIDVEFIPGEPGQTVVAVGTGGIGIERIPGTPDKRLFRSYIFTRK